MSASHQPAILSFVDLATRYCTLIERAAGLTAADLLVDAERRLPALYSAALDLPDTEPTTDDWQTGSISSVTTPNSSGSRTRAH